MEKLSMCRLCTAEEVRLLNIVNTHLQEMYESLILIPLETEDMRPIHVCYICCARLQNCYQLRKRGLRSEELFREMLKTKSFRVKRVTGEVPNGLELTAVVHESVGDVPKKNNTPAVLEDPGVKIKEEKDKIPFSQESGDAPSLHIKEESFDVEFNVEDELLCEDVPHFEPLDAPSNVVKNIFEDFTTNRNDELLSENHTEMCEDFLRFVPHEASSNIVKNENFRTSAHEAETISSRTEIEGAVDTTSYKQEQTVAEEGLNNNYTAEAPLHTLSTDTNYTILLLKSVDANHFTVNRSGRSGLRVYGRSVNRNKLFTCDICKEGFIKKSDLLKHTLNIHPCVQTDECESKMSAKEEIDLSYTVTDFKQINYLATDVDLSLKKCKSESDEYSKYFYPRKRPEPVLKPYHCLICNKFYGYGNSLEAHLRIHRPKPYQCTECNEGYYNKHTLETHMYTHTQEKPYICDICKKGFTSKQLLKVHILEHPEIKIYKCDDCFKSFAYKRSLNAHMRVHNGIKQNPCDVCQQRFPHATSFKSRKQIHNFHIQFYCNICKQYFNDKSDLESHMLVNHGEVSKL